MVFQNNMGNLHSPNVIALPFTGSIKKLGQPTHVLVRAEESGLKIDSVVLCENPQRMSKEKIGRFITKLSRKQMREIAAASLIASSAIAYLDLDALILAWRKAILLNFDSPEQTDDRPEVWNV